MSNAAKNENLDQLYCQSISKSISDVIRYSLDESFRKRSFELFGVSCTADTEKEIYKKLTTLIESKNSKKNQDVIEEGDLMEVDHTDAKPSETKINDSQSHNMKRNWLQISSQQYKESIKCKRICFFSQPENRNDLFGCTVHKTNCENAENLLKAKNYCNEKFKSSFSSITNIRPFTQ